MVKGYKYQDCDNWKFVPECGYGCNCRNTAELCDRRTGACTSGCADGWRNQNNVCQRERPRLTRAPVVSSRTAHSVTLAWDSWSPDRYPGVGSVSSYNVSAWKDSYIASSNKTTSVSTTSLTIGHLAEYTDYNFTVTIVDEEGNNGQQSPSVTRRTCGELVLPPAVDSAVTGQKTTAQIKITTQGMTEAVHRCDAFSKLKLSYEGEYGDSNTIEITDVPVSKELILGSLIPYSNYTINISAVNNLNLEGPMLKVYKFTPEGIPPKMAPPVAVSRSHNTIELRWEAPRPPGGIVTEYKISYGMGENNWGNSLKLNASTYWKPVGSLTYNRTYWFRIRAGTNIGNGEYSDSVQARTVEEKPGPPTNFTNTSRSDTSLEFSWNEPFIRNGEITGYKIECSVDGKNILAELAMSARKVVVSKLKPGTRYLCGLMAKTSAGYGDSSQVITWTKPSVPNDIEVTPVSQSLSQRTASSITIMLPSKHYGDLYKYRIVVEKESKAKRRRRALDLNDSKIQRLVPCQSVTDTDQLLCVAAELSADDLGKPFTVGDNKTYGGYYNRPLEEGKSYNIYFGPVQTVDGITSQAYVSLVRGVIPQMDVKILGLDVGVLVGGVVPAILAVAGVAIAVWIYMRRRRRGLEATHSSSASDREMKSLKVETRNEDYEVPNYHMPENPYMELSWEHLDDNMEQVTDIPVEDIFTVMKKKNREVLKAEYEKLPTVFTATCHVGQKQENQMKNRFDTILPYDHSRVPLTPLPGDPHSDYINANYIDGYGQTGAFIACQGPKRNTVKDFWRMVWQEDSPVIVMLTNLTEDAKTKCAKYWPDEGSKRFGLLIVTLKKEETRTDFTVRTLHMSMLHSNSSTKTVKQFHFTGWPDHGVPVDFSALVQFRDKFKWYQKKVECQGPIIVHSSAGVGRTGTFIALDYLLDQAEAEGKINIFNLVQLMRKSRPMMIQTEEQYYFIHDAMLEELYCGNTTVLVQKLQPYLHRLKQVDIKSGLSKLEREFAVLQMCVGSDDIEKPLTSVSVNKNCVRNSTPANGCRPYLSTPADGSADYINTFFLDGYRRADAYIVTQTPLPDTVVDFWRTMYDHNSATIVMMNEAAEIEIVRVCFVQGYIFILQEDALVKFCNNIHIYRESYFDGNSNSLCFCIFKISTLPHKTFGTALCVPKSGSTTYGPFTVEVVSTLDAVNSCAIKELTLKSRNRTKEQPRKIRQFQLQGWKTSDPTPSSTEPLLELLDEVQHWQQQSGNTTITVHCMNGDHRSGVFCALDRILEKMKVEQQVDVFHTVKAVRINKPQFIDSLEQYRFCYAAVEEYAWRFDTYSPAPR
ncbi:receptor-type tyrosine-protein phosphatase delta-like [Lingula anatina]|uniref:Receptor-type tyrosine-protein phosphatase delta-like n=1 Tax=Lingula anatina TaxID=7574 RepID=A0A2R2MS27_LINAN|nr:receptor-type tyrosine-protein phosphatase delta-like [Lingula anatina]|eukprot:XP_023933066.1 receptor-type tyrosine-protein phosphatase delta-like [Lingula anatina]